MAKLVFGMNQSLDGYVDHMAFAPSPTLFRHFIEEAQGQAGSVYGRQMYEVMRYWDDDQPEWDAEEHAFAAAWRNQPKWVVSRSLKSVGPNARLVEDDLEGAIRELKAERDGEIEVAGPDLAQSLTELGLIDKYRIYLHLRSTRVAAIDHKRTDQSISGGRSMPSFFIRNCSVLRFMPRRCAAPRGPAST